MIRCKMSFVDVHLRPYSNHFKNTKNAFIVIVHCMVKTQPLPLNGAVIKTSKHKSSMK